MEKGQVFEGRAWLVLAAVLVGALAGCLGGKVPPGTPGAEVGGTVNAPDGEALFISKCASCHPLNTTTTQDKTGYGWRKTVEKMAEEYGADKSPGMTAEEAEAIIKYLADNY